ncbi:hypothetical protein [Kribbella jejuensis]|uniref:Uncharacterized protein n=1 Tax=Kribbella jejuensis TaxID=236068 RepID=A0A542D9S8_9ACTN|nr:hypothetical protein [Kribbella jejuensis]TQI99828.1 hypothetical protein FB475_6816 [Kribbella jejuensis]
MGAPDRDLTDNNAENNAEYKAAYYAENRRRADLAQREFAERTHGWRFTLSADAAAWAATRPGPVLPTDLTHLVEEADAAGLFLKPEPGTIRSAFSSRDPYTEETSGAGFGFWPTAAEHLVVKAGTAVAYDQLNGLDALGVLHLVVDTFATPTASYEQA